MSDRITKKRLEMIETLNYIQDTTPGLILGEFKRNSSHLDA